MTLDLLVLMLTYLPPNEASALFENCLTSEILESPTLRTLAARVLEKAEIRLKEINGAEVEEVVEPQPQQAFVAIHIRNCS